MIYKTRHQLACFGDSPDPPPPPAPPPPPPITLDQEAPKTSSGTSGDQLTEGAAGIKKYRNPSIGSSTKSDASTSTGLGINS